MKAIVYTHYGSPDVLQFKETEKPVPNAGEILVKIYAASANPLDWHLMRGAPFLARLEGGLRKPKDPRFGADLAGRVEAVGSTVTQFQLGDEVFGAWTGSFAEYATVPENRVALKPANRSFEEAAAIPVAAITALQGLRDAGHIHTGQKVLINGASGGVGSFAVQFAKAFGAEVTGVCSTRNLDMVLHTPVTSAPNALANCTANEPTPPEAPLIRTFCPAWMCPVSRRPCRAVMAATGMAAASSNERLAGFNATLFSGTVAYSAKLPVHAPKTSSPS